MQESKKPATKKPYSAPQLMAYGDIREITNTTAAVGNQDNPIRPAVKTGGNL